MAEWEVYTGSDEQIVALLTSSDKFIVDSKWSIFKDPTKLSILPLESNIDWLRKLLNNCDVKRFMFCKPHPYADIIKIWADTGCEVYERYNGSAKGVNEEFHLLAQKIREAYPVGLATYRPNWNSSLYDFSLTPFEE